MIIALFFLAEVAEGQVCNEQPGRRRGCGDWRRRNNDDDKREWGGKGENGKPLLEYAAHRPAGWCFNTKCNFKVPSRDEDPRQAVFAYWDAAKARHSTDPGNTMAQIKADADVVLNLINQQGNYANPAANEGNGEVEAEGLQGLLMLVKSEIDTFAGEGSARNTLQMGAEALQSDEKNWVQRKKENYDNMDAQIMNVNLPPSQTSTGVAAKLYTAGQLKEQAEKDAMALESAATGASSSIAQKKDLILGPYLDSQLEAIDAGNDALADGAVDLVDGVVAADGAGGSAAATDVNAAGVEASGAAATADDIAQTAQVASHQTGETADVVVNKLVGTFETQTALATQMSQDALSSADGLIGDSSSAIHSALDTDTDETTATVDDVATTVDKLSGGLGLAMEKTLRDLVKSVDGRKGPLGEMNRTTHDADDVKDKFDTVLETIETGEGTISEDLRAKEYALNEDRELYRGEDNFGPTEDDLNVAFAAKTNPYKFSNNLYRAALITDLQEAMAPYFSSKKERLDMMEVLSTFSDTVEKAIQKDSFQPEDHSTPGVAADPRTFDSFAERAEALTADLEHNLSISSSGLTGVLDGTMDYVKNVMEQEGVPDQIRANASETENKIQELVQEKSGGFSGVGVWEDQAKQLAADRQKWKNFVEQFVETIRKSKQSMEKQNVDIQQHGDTAVELSDRFLDTLAAVDAAMKTDVESMDARVKRNFTYFDRNVDESATDLAGELAGALRRHLLHYNAPQGVLRGLDSAIHTVKLGEDEAGFQLWKNLSAISEAASDPKKPFEIATEELNSAEKRLDGVQVPSLSASISNNETFLKNQVTEHKQAADAALKEKASEWTSRLAEEERGALGAVAALAASSTQTAGSMGRMLGGLLGGLESEKVDLTKGIDGLSADHQNRLLMLASKMGLLQGDMADLASLQPEERKALLKDLALKFGGLEGIAAALSGQLYRKLSPALQALKNAAERAVQGTQTEAAMDFSQLASALGEAGKLMLKSVTTAKDEVAAAKQKMATNAQQRAVVFQEMKQKLAAGEGGNAQQVKEADKLGLAAEYVTEQVQDVYDAIQNAFKEFEEYEYPDELQRVMVKAAVDKSNLEEAMKGNNTVNTAAINAFTMVLQQNKDEFDTDVASLQTEWSTLKNSYADLETKLKLHGIDMSKDFDMLTPLMDSLNSKVREERSSLVGQMVQTAQRLFSAAQQGIEVTKAEAEQAKIRMKNVSSSTIDLANSTVVKTLGILRDADDRVKKVTTKLIRMNDWAANFSQQKKKWRQEVEKGFELFNRDFKDDYTAIDNAMQQLSTQLSTDEQGQTREASDAVMKASGLVHALVTSEGNAISSDVARGEEASRLVGNSAVNSGSPLMSGGDNTTLHDAFNSNSDELKELAKRNNLLGYQLLNVAHGSENASWLVDEILGQRAKEKDEAVKNVQDRLALLTNGPAPGSLYQSVDTTNKKITSAASEIGDHPTTGSSFVETRFVASPVVVAHLLKTPQPLDAHAVQALHDSGVAELDIRAALQVRHERLRERVRRLQASRIQRGGRQ
jgi:hypothetical protein